MANLEAFRHFVPVEMLARQTPERAQPIVAKGGSMTFGGPAPFAYAAQGRYGRPTPGPTPPPSPGDGPGPGPGPKPAPSPGPGPGPDDNPNKPIGPPDDGKPADERPDVELVWPPEEARIYKRVLDVGLGVNRASVRVSDPEDPERFLEILRMALMDFAYTELREKKRPGHQPTRSSSWQLQFDLHPPNEAP